MDDARVGFGAIREGEIVFVVGDIPDHGGTGVTFFDLHFALDGAVGVENLIGDVGHDGGAAWSDAAFGDEDEEAGEELVDGKGGVKFGGLREKVGGEVFEVAGRRDEG
jgi:hypothetical protein